MASERRIAFLTNLIPPYHLALYRLLSSRFEHFRFFISTEMEANRPWRPEWAGLDVVPQKSVSLSKTWNHPSGFSEPSQVHFPVDTLGHLKAFRPDVIVSVEMGFRSLLALLYAKLHPGCRFLIWSEVTPLTEEGRGRVRTALRKRLVKKADSFLALGPGGARYLESLGAPAERIHKIAYSTSLAEFLAIPAERERSAERRLLYSGQMIERKGLEPFLAVLKQWAERHPETETEFLLVGDGPLRTKLETMPMAANVKLMFAGALQYAELPEVYRTAGIFVLPTLADTWAVVVNEAMASAMPVLGSLFSQAVEEMVEDGETGWMFRPDEPAEMYRALDRALSCSEDRLRMMRVKARRRAMDVTPENAAAVFERAVGVALAPIGEPC